MEKKYKLVEPDEDVSFPMYNDAGTLTGVYHARAYRVMAVRDIGPSVPAGSLGGYVEGEHNLSHEGNCWIHGNGYVYQDARIEGNTYVTGAYIMGSAIIKMDNGRIDEGTTIKGNVNIDIKGDSLVSIRHCTMLDNASIKGTNNGVVYIYNCKMNGNASIVVGSSKGAASRGLRNVDPSTLLYKGICFGGNMNIIGNKGYIHIEPLIGDEHGNMALTITPNEFICADKFGRFIEDNQIKAYITNKYRELIHTIQVQLSLEAAHV